MRLPCWAGQKKTPEVAERFQASVCDAITMVRSGNFLAWHDAPDSISTTSTGSCVKR